MLVEGIFSIMVSIMIFFCLPEEIGDSLLSDSEVPRDSNRTLAAPSKLHISPRLVWQTLTNTKRLPHFIATGCVFSTWSPLTTYTPSIFVQSGFSHIEANSLAAIGSLLTIPVILLFAWMSDRSKRRGFTVMVAISFYLITLVILRVFQNYVGKWGKFGLWTAVNAFAVGYHPIHNAWIQINCKTPEERSISVA
jgi:sugar phosphate permease